MGEGVRLHPRLEAMDEGRRYRRIEVITGRRQRRSYTAEEKARIVAESAAPDANISEVARRNGVNRISPASAALKASQFAVLSGVFWRTPSYERTYDGIGIEG